MFITWEHNNYLVYYSACIYLMRASSNNLFDRYTNVYIKKKKVFVNCYNRMGFNNELYIMWKNSSITTECTCF